MSKCGSLLSRGQALSAVYFIPSLPRGIRHKIQKVTASPQTPVMDLLILTYSVFSNRDMVKKAKCTQRDKQKSPNDDNSLVHSKTT